ncbi:MAG TPA: helix-turn-helix transcriptional regulator [Candidatus Udaeobacter sp.]|jgi:transcriptional regulator with XRE-family HTH domain
MRKASAAGFRAVRKATGLSQVKFAAAIGVSKATVENIELGRAPISDDLAETIGAFTGAAPWTISSNEGPRDYNGGRYSTQSWKHWQDYQYNDEQITELTEAARDALRVLLEAAARNSAGQHSSHIFRTVLLEFNKFIFAQRDKHRLESRINTLMQDDLTVEEGETTVGEIRPELRSSPQWQANENPKWKAATKVRYKKQCIPEFVPFLGFGILENRIPFFVNQRRPMRCIYTFYINGHEFRVVHHEGEVHIMVPWDATLHEKLQLSDRRKRKV